jgi:hypothetical protein
MYWGKVERESILPATRYFLVVAGVVRKGYLKA